MQRLTDAPRRTPDSAHSIVVIGLGVESTPPFATIALVLDEYSDKRQDITGNCFRYNRIEASRPSAPGKVQYFAFEVPAGIYIYSRRNANSSLDPPAMGSAFTAAPGATVYFGDYVFVGHQSVEFRRDIDSARAASGDILPRDAVLAPAQAATTMLTHPFICTP